MNLLKKIFIRDFYLSFEAACYFIHKKHLSALKSDI